ncbi:MAG: 2Fe-2S iron-sulfur cluster-binding protein [Hoeflea sp.]|uniref:2Fe-2S iron-sulfur cluster-binding protein n=1 Tax=Hoeflea sp. TaxID=1940281 RepID=UPI003EF5901D
MTTITLPQLSRRFEAASEQTILDAAFAHGIAYPHGCLSGRCGACKSRLLEGEVVMAKHSPFALTAEEAAEGQILACVATPVTPVSIEWLDTDYVPREAAKISARVLSTTKATHDVVILRLRPSEPMAFAAGQYLSLKIEGTLARHYSMANTPGAGLIELHVRIVPGGRTSGLVSRLVVGDVVRLTGPMGSSYFRETHTGPILAVAGGTGLAPVKSIIEAALALDPDRHVLLYFGVRTQRDLYYVAHFRALEARHAGFTFIPVVAVTDNPAHRSGMVTDAIAEDIRDLSGFSIYMAGPPPMVEAMQDLASQRGAQANRVYADVFFTPEAAKQEELL